MENFLFLFAKVLENVFFFLSFGDLSWCLFCEMSCCGYEKVIVSQFFEMNGRGIWHYVLCELCELRELYELLSTAIGYE